MITINPNPKSVTIFKVMYEEWQLRQDHDEEIKNIMELTGSTFRNWKGKEFWEKANEAGHTSLDFNKCKCKNYGSNNL
jgi:phosphomannomutase